jgi:Tol biopolymer transport system component
MGEVYRARDRKLGRQVAIKVLPSEVARDPERLGRFRREASLLAALNHPHIASIHGLEESDGSPFLVLLVEGEDLSQRLKRGAIPVGEALEIAEQIAEGLEEAHGKGIVHRDLKPGNVKLTPEGKVKVLDFGLAKAYLSDPVSAGAMSDLSQSPTLAQSGTVAGVILGTAAYMSPEQASGKAVDKRADIWSFGVVLFEMLTGAQLFSGETASDVMAAVLKEEPAWDRLPAECPATIAKLLRRCLRKRPRERLQDVGDARLEIQEVRAGTAVEATPSPGDVEGALRTERRRHSRERWAWVAVALALAGIAAFFALQRVWGTAVPRQPSRFVLEMPEDRVLSSFDAVSVSPDGRRIAYVAASAGGPQQLWMRSLDSPEARPLPGTEGATAAFWSADGAEVAFVVGDELRKLALVGGAVQRLCTLPGFFTGGTWSSEGTIVFSAGGARARLYTVSQSGGEAKLLMPHDASRGETAHSWPEFLPDARHMLFDVTSTEEDNAGFFVTSLEDPGRRKRIRPELARFRFAAPGYLVVMQGGNLLSYHFDPRTQTTTGEAALIASDVAGLSVVPNTGYFAASETGILAWLSGSTEITQLEWVDRQGRRVGTVGEPAAYGQIALSPDGQRVAAEIADANGRYGLWVIDAVRGGRSRFTTDSGNDRDPVWSPDSQQIVYTSWTGEENLIRKGLQGSGTPAALPDEIGQTPGDRDIAKDWSSEENTLLYLTIGAERILWRASLDGHGSPEPLAKGYAVDQPRVSPDGRWLAYISQESGRFEVYVVPFGQDGERVRASTLGGGQPRWRGDDKELFYLSLDGALMAVSVRAGAIGVEVEPPTMLVPARDLMAVGANPDFSSYSVASDGQRFLVKRRSGGDERPRIHVLLDWPSLLEPR